MSSKNKHYISWDRRLIKRLIDIVLSSIGIYFLGWVVFIGYIISSIDTRSNGLFFQRRVGQWGKPFTIIKLKTMVTNIEINTTVTTNQDPRITKIGNILRKLKIDELPQLFNVFIGHMSFVGPRPDVPGYADKLTGEDRIILSIRPGMTGPASLSFRNEEVFLNKQANPQQYNDEIVYPQKVKINKDYIISYSIKKDIYYIIKTINLMFDDIH